MTEAEELIKVDLLAQQYEVSRRTDNNASLCTRGQLSRCRWCRPVEAEPELAIILN
jgi:hypothetical protein